MLQPAVAAEAFLLLVYRKGHNSTEWLYQTYTVPSGKVLKGDILPMHAPTPLPFTPDSDITGLSCASSNAGPSRETVQVESFVEVVIGSQSGVYFFARVDLKTGGMTEVASYDLLDSTQALAVSGTAGLCNGERIIVQTSTYLRWGSCTWIWELWKIDYNSSQPQLLRKTCISESERITAVSVGATLTPSEDGDCDLFSVVAGSDANEVIGALVTGPIRDDDPLEV